ncbi:MAG: hypothetical protein ACLUNZ_00635 [Evtepia sp.]
MATGVLPVFVGRATRAVEFAAEREKEYLAGLTPGAGHGHPGRDRLDALAPLPSL